MQVDRVVVGVSESGGSLRALRYAADLARTHGATLAPVHCWTPPGGELADRRYPCAELRAVWTERAWERLWHSVELALGGPPADLAFTPHSVKGEAGLTLTRIAARPGDILVIGAGRRGPLHRALSCQVTRYCLANSSCPVLAMPPSPLDDAPRGQRAWGSRPKLATQSAELHVTGA